MNTRLKIIDLSGVVQSLAGSQATLVIGTFDPLLASHAARFSELTSQNEAKVVVAVADVDGEPILALSSRLEMVAALAVVDFVLPYGPGTETALAWTSIHDDTALHQRWSDEFKDHVRRRSQPSQ